MRSDAIHNLLADGSRRVAPELKCAGSLGWGRALQSPSPGRCLIENHQCHQFTQFARTSVARESCVLEYLIVEQWAVRPEWPQLITTPLSSAASFQVVTKQHYHHMSLCWSDYLTLFPSDATCTSWWWGQISYHLTLPVAGGSTRSVTIFIRWPRLDCRLAPEFLRD
jgi:hypothetical protein